ncbi:MAG TPA: isocitrate lyase/phosphoenolpyruvate mutase family protein [Candidatus Acidoferrales bacterium]|nr:isocitrate lyase/phosphoenolpyruvate mutase family protein [Candidatus Acidoferrales bacterium]
MMARGKSDLAAKADAFRALHAGPKLLVLPNAWDAASAVLIQAAGFPAIATSSAGCASALGFGDGNQVPRKEMLAAVRRIAASVEIPVSADMESGYGSGPESASRLAEELIEAGAIGLNLEDGTCDAAKPFKDLSQSVEEIRAIRETSDRAGVRLVINARTDTYWEGRGTADENFAQAMRRCRAYCEAGADCSFLPGLKDLALIERFVSEVGGPLNVLPWPGMPGFTELERIGLRRLSFGGTTSRSAYGNFRRLLQELANGGGVEEILKGYGLTYQEMNSLFAKRSAAH